LKTDILVVGAGFAGSVIAERYAAEGKSVVIVEKREHIGGNAFDEFDGAGVLVHRYGPHIFHTNSPQISNYLSRFTEWRSYEHKVLAMVNSQLYPVPINRTTINRLYGLSLDQEGVARYLESVRTHRMPVLNSEDVVLNNVGSDLCDKFFRGYTKKQWNLDLSELSPAVAGRIPVRTNDDDRYFTDDFQKMPSEGYTKMFERMLRHPNIRVELGTDFASVKGKILADKVFYSGPIDSYFDHRFGKLPYRSLSFEHEHLTERSQYQPVGTVNYPNDLLFTRITEFKHLTGQSHAGTSIVREYPQSEGDPYYPIPTSENLTLYRKYSELADAEKNTYFIGRLAEYRYYNMDQVVASALTLHAKCAKGQV
jgi:UDP-galactopyranose mutase